MDKVTIILTDRLKEKLEIFRKEHKSPSLSSAIRLLLFTNTDILVIMHRLEKHDERILKLIDRRFDTHEKKYSHQAGKPRMDQSKGE